MDKKEMKVFFSNGFGKGEIKTMPIPRIDDNEALVKIYYCGICGTDQDLFSGDCSFVKNGQVTYPLRPGHEWSGIVEEVGRNVKGLKKGDRVVGDNAVACGKCEACKSGNLSGCRNILNVGTIEPVYDGAFCEYFVFPSHHLHKIPDWLPLMQAALCEPLSVAYAGIKKMDITEKSVVAVIGTGCIAMAAVVLAKCKNAGTVIVIGRNPKKLAAAEALGAKTINVRNCDCVKEINSITDGKGADFVLECSGAEGTFKEAIAIARFRAVVALIGFYDKTENDVNIDTIVSKALYVFGVMGEFGNMSGALLMLDGKGRDLSPVITDILPFNDCIKGFSRKNYPNAIKIMVEICKE